MPTGFSWNSKLILRENSIETKNAVEKCRCKFQKQAERASEGEFSQRCLATLIINTPPQHSHTYIIHTT